jgi:peptidyl-prolyl cis-trans isomerase SurA
MNLIQDYSRVQMEAEENKRQMIIDKWVEKYKKETYIHINQQYSTCENLKKWQNE